MTPIGTAAARDTRAAATSGSSSTPVESGAPTLLRPETHLCANCEGRFPAKPRPTPYCTLQCAAEAKAVRYGRKQRAEFGDDLPAGVRVLMARKLLHALVESVWDKWSGEPEPDPVTPPDVHPLAGHLDENLPDGDDFLIRAHALKVRVMSKRTLRPCDAEDWDGAWRDWVNTNAR